MRQTGRTETSKYPEEKKSTEISLVAAKEPVSDNDRDRGTSWEAWRYRVIAPYSKSRSWY